MRKFFDKLANAARRARDWLTGTPPARLAARCYDRAIVLTGPRVLWLFYGGDRRARVFNTSLGLLITRVTWEIIAFPVTLGYLVRDGLRALARGARRAVTPVARWTLLVLGYAWAFLTLVWTVELSFYAWVGNTIIHAVVRSLQWVYYKLSGAEAMPRRVTRLMWPTEVLAFELAIFAHFHAFPLWLARGLVGEQHTYRVVQFVTDWVARLHGPTYDWFFNAALPYGTPPDGGAVTALIVTDVPFEETRVPRDEISDRERMENWFVSNGYLLIAEPGDQKSETEVFNEHVRERWANINAAEIATDEFGRTWVVPMENTPLFKDVATTTFTSRNFADKELAWTTDENPTTRAHSFGRHWAAALTDQDERFLADPNVAKKERALMYAKMRNRADLPIEHVLRGFDEFVAHMHRNPAGLLPSKSESVKR